MTAAKTGTFSEAYTDLRRPFTPEAVNFKVQAQWPKGDPTGAQIVAFVDARLVAGRLNAVCPDLWSDDTIAHPSGKGAICKLTVCDVTRSDYGQHDYENAKGDFSDAFKRAAVKMGVGESLYVLPKMTLSVGNLLKKSQNKKLSITREGLNYCRNVYKMWLDDVGRDVYGEPFDHGDKIVIADEGPTIAEQLGELMVGSDFNDDQLVTIRNWLGNGNGKLDPTRANKAVHLLLADETEVLLARAENATVEIESKPETKEPVSV